MSRTTRAFLNLGYLLVLAVIVANGVVATVNIRTILESDRWIDHTREVIIELERTLSLLKDAETGQRGYLLTGEDEYLDPFRSASADLDGAIGRLAVLTSDNPSQRSRIADLQGLKAAKMSELSQTIALYNESGQTAALAVVKTHRGKQVMDRARRVVLEIAREEDRLLRSRSLDSLRATRWAFGSTALVMTMAVALLGAVVMISRREDRKNRESAEALRQSEDRLRLIVDSAEEYAIFTMDLEGRIASWNVGARKMTGFEAADVIGQHSDMIFLREDVERGAPSQEVDKAHERGRAENERWHLRKDGSRFWASGLMMPMRDGDRIVGYLKIMRDTTEEKRVEQELQVSRERLDLVVNSSEVGLWYCDLPFEKLIWNAKCKQHFGLPPEAEVSIETFFDRLHTSDRGPTRAAIERSIEEHADYDAEYRTVDPEGRVRWIRAIGRAFYDIDGKPIRFDGITVDVTNRIKQEEALREADRRKDEFLATLAHELRNPLAPIRNVLVLLREATAGSGSLESERSMAERHVSHLARLVDDLLDVARISRGKIELRREMVDLNGVIARAAASARAMIDERGHRLVCEPSEHPLRVDGDATRLEQVFWNLLNNASKYSDPGGTITLRAGEVDDQAVVRVRDTGLGIEPEMLSRIFEPFVQASNDDGYTQGGLGIGLSLVRSLVEMHGGSVEAHSDGPGQGSEFVVRLPLVKARTNGHPIPAPSAPSHDADEPLERHRILIVDDNRDAANSLARLLERVHGQDVRVSYDGPSALDEAEVFRPHVILLDIGMPGMDGHEVARRLRGRSEFADVLLLALSGWGQERDRQTSKEAGFDHHLVKPVDLDELRSLLSEFSRGSS